MTNSEERIHAIEPQQLLYYKLLRRIYDKYGDVVQLQIQICKFKQGHLREVEE